MKLNKAILQFELCVFQGVPEEPIAIIEDVGIGEKRSPEEENVTLPVVSSDENNEIGFYKHDFENKKVTFSYNKSFMK